MSEEKTPWQIIADALQAKGIDVFPPATHKRDCMKPYVMLKQDGIGQVLGYSSDRVYFRFQIYVPQDNYNLLDEMEKKVKDVLDNDLYPFILPSGSQEPDWFDDNINAHMRAFIYHITRRRKH